MWRIHFTAEDLVRTTVAPTLGPLAETMFAFNLMRHGGSCAALSMRSWRNSVRGGITPVMKPLADLAPGRTLGVDLWSLTGQTTSIEEGVEALLAMHTHSVRTELEFFSDPRLPKSAWAVADRDGAGRRDLAQAALSCYRHLVQPHWIRVQDHLRAERAMRGRVLLDEGIEGLLTRLHRRIRWQAPILEVQAHNSSDIHLMGRGLILVPSVFVGDRVVMLTDLTRPELPPRLVFPCTGRDTVEFGKLFVDESSRTHPLSALLGHNRAMVLRRIADGCTTTSELARRSGLSLAAASQHATVLRKAGLITTRRDGGAVLHSLTSLGANLLDGN